LFTEFNGGQFIVRQSVPGMTLQDRMTSDTMTYWEAADIVCRIAEAIHAAHQRQVFHRDLIPANILMDTEGRPHVADVA
jgi:serine/threonine protein kinase